MQFLGSRDGGGQGGNGNGFSAPQSDVPADTSDFSSPEPASVGAGGGGDEDIPF